MDPIRIGQLDALRGIAAFEVVLYHLTAGFTNVGGSHRGSLPFLVPDASAGVYLFFVISGFVIYMTLDRSKGLADFAVSRFSRLFPAYWMCVTLTLAVVLVAGPPPNWKVRNWADALANYSMLQQFLGRPHVDYSYWTLEVELCFYVIMGILFALGMLRRIRVVLALWITVSLGFGAVRTAFGVLPSWTLNQYLILDFVPFFAVGICAYLVFMERGSRLSSWAVLLYAGASLFLTQSPVAAAYAVSFGVIVLAVTRYRPRILNNALLTALGAISYPLYLIHQEIGYVVLERMYAAGAGTTIAIGAALAVALLLASGVNRLVENPAKVWIRGRYKERRAVRPI